VGALSNRQGLAAGASGQHAIAKPIQAFASCFTAGDCCRSTTAQNQEPCLSSFPAVDAANPTFTPVLITLFRRRWLSIYAEWIFINVMFINNKIVKILKMSMSTVFTARPT
jgi:hypothetical protein